jgi:hypothetical protein
VTLDEDQDTQGPIGPIVLFLNEADREGATSSLKAARRYYKKKKLDSGVENWRSIVQLIDDNDVSAVLAKATSFTFHHLADPIYKVVADELLDRISKFRHIFYVHESVFTGVAKEDPFDDGYFGPSPYFTPPENSVRKTALEKLGEHNVVYVVYTTNAQLSVLASQFLEDTESHLVFRIYIPTGSIFSSESERALGLFQHFLLNVSRLHIRYSKYATSNGTVHEFFAQNNVDASEVPQKMQAFAEFLDLASSNAFSAMQMLENNGISKSAAADIVDKYSKEVSRLKIDIRQEWERKRLSIKHRLESDLVGSGMLEEDQIDNVVDEVLGKAAPSISSAMDASIPRSVFPTISIKGPVIFGNVRGIVAETVSGTTHLGIEAQEIMELIRHHGGDNVQDLRTSLLQLEDAGTKGSQRQTAGAKLRTFLLKLASKASMSAVTKASTLTVSALAEYVKSQVGL